MTPLSDEDQALLRRVRSVQPPPHVSARMKAHLVASLAVGGPPGPAVPSQATAMGRLPRLGTKALLVSGAGVVAGGVLLWLAVRSAPHAPPPPLSAPQQLPVSAAPTPSARVVAEDLSAGVHSLDALPLEASQAPQRAAGGASTRRESPTPASSQANPRASTDLEEELRLLGVAQRAMQQGQWPRAIEALDAHATRFPSGALTTERRGLQLVVGCRTGQPGAATEAAAFLAKHPDTTLAARLRGACGL